MEDQSNAASPCLIWGCPKGLGIHPKHVMTEAAKDAMQAGKPLDARTSNLQPPPLDPSGINPVTSGPYPEPKGKPGRPKGFDGTRSRMPSALAQSFKKAGLDWKEDFAKAIKENKRERIKLWLKLLPYMITTSKKAKVGRWKGKPSRAAKVALEAMERDL